VSSLPTPLSAGARRALGVLTATGLLTTALSGAVAAAAPAPTPDAVSATAKADAPKKASGDKLGSADRQKLEEAQADGERTITAMVVAADGRDATARKDLEALGGTVRYSSPELGYASVVLPTASVEKAAKLSSVFAVDLDEVVPLPEERPVGAAAAKGNLNAPDATTPDSNPFMPTRDTGSVAFKRDHRTWDGRRTTIGILDSGIDLSHPALQRTSNGKRKIVDTFTATDPVTEGSLVTGGDATWLPMVQDATGPTFGPYRGSTWTLPAGTYKIRTFDEAGTNIPGCEICGDVNRDGDTTDRIGVLYDPESHDIRVDSNGNKDFTDDEVMRPYAEDFQVGTFGTDKPFTDVREEIPFTVDFRLDQSLAPLGPQYAGVSYDFVDIGIVSGAHGSHVAGIAAANDMFGGRMDGQAPGARLVSARACSFGPGCTAAALTDGMAELATRGVDVINMSIGGLPALNDGNNARAELYNRIINDLGVQILISAGNSGNALNTIGDPSVATDVVSVGASITKSTWLANYGSEVRFDKGMLTFSSGGPREDGGFKPNVTAPGSAISTTPTWQPGGPVAEAGYDLPAGYSMFNGTSMASPQAAGAAALLLSAAKQSGTQGRKPAALRQAMYSSAVPIGDVPTFLQGHGEVDVPRAWDLFARNLKPETFTVSAPVCNEVWNILERTSGTGLYNRCAAGDGGPVAGTARSYPVTITRTSGPAAARTYRVSVKGNDGTFTPGSTRVRLARGKAVTIQVDTLPTEGTHSALLQLDDTRTAGLDASVMMAITASPALAAPSFSKTATGTAYRNETTRHYVTVPEGAKALQVTLDGIAEGSQTRWIAFHPFGLPIDSTSSLACYTNRPVSGGCNPNDRVYSDPQPGVWELVVESRRTSPLLANPYTLTASVLGVTVTPPVQTLPSVEVGEAAPVSWTVRNDFGTVQARAVGGPLGSRETETATIADGGQVERTVEVPEGATRFDVSIGGTSDPAADLDLTVNGPSGTQSDADGDSEESVSYVDPKPGTYTITVDGYEVPAGTTTFTLNDAFTSPELGTLTVPAESFTLEAGQTRTVTGAVTAAAAAPEGRTLSGQMSVVSSSGAVLGTGTVVIDEVTG